MAERKETKVERYYTAEEVAEIIGLSKSTVLKLCKNGYLNHIRIGMDPQEGKRDNRQYRFTEADIEDYMLRGREVHKAVAHVRDPDIKEWRRKSVEASQRRRIKMAELEERAQENALLRRYQESRGAV